MISTGKFVIENPLQPVIDIKVRSSQTVIPVKAIVDTGATVSAVSKKIVDELNLKKKDVTKVSGMASDNACVTDLFLIDVGFPFAYIFENVPVVMIKGSLEHVYDFIIGMDIISQGDLLITNTDGQTCLSLCFPSHPERIDFNK